MRIFWAILMSLWCAYAWGQGRSLTYNTNDYTLTPTFLLWSNLAAGDNITLSTNARGRVVITGAAGGGGAASNAVTQVNGNTNAQQFFQVGTSGSDFAVATNGAGNKATNTFNLPTASATVRGALSTTDWSTFNVKQPGHATLTNLAGITTNQLAFTNASAVTRTIFVDPNGDNATGTKGRRDKPFASALNATNAATSGDTIHLIAGYHDLVGETLYLPKGVRLTGEGMDITVLNSAPAGVGRCVVISDNCVVEGITFQTTNGAIGPSPWGFTGAITNAYVINCRMRGRGDCIYQIPAGTKMTWANCLFNSEFDTIIMSGGDIDWYNCHFRTFANSALNNGVTGVFLEQQGGTNRFWGGSAEVRNFNAENQGIQVDSGLVELHSFSLSCVSTSGIVYAITNFGGTVLLDNSLITGDVLGPGTYTNATRLPHQVGEPYGATFGKVDAKTANHTNALTDHVVTYDTSGGTVTNTLPEIGYRTVLDFKLTNQPSAGNSVTIGGRTWTWSASAVDECSEIQIGSTVAESALLMQAYLESCQVDGGDGVVYQNDTNVVYTSKQFGNYAGSMVGTWATMVVTTNLNAYYEGRQIVVKDVGGAAGTSNIRIQTARNAYKIDGQASYTITNNYGVVAFIVTGTNWSVIADNRDQTGSAAGGSATNAISNLDGRGTNIYNGGWYYGVGPFTNAGALRLEEATVLPTRLELAETNAAASPRYTVAFEAPRALTNNITYRISTNLPTSGSSNLAMNVTAGGTGVTNEFTYVSSASGGSSSQAVVTVNIDGAWVKLFAEDGWEPYQLDEFGSLNTSGRIGDGDWTVGLNAGGTLSVLAWGVGGHPGILDMVTTNVADRSVVIGGNNNASSILTTNMQMFFLGMVRVRNANDATDVNGLRIGVAGAATIEAQNQIVWRTTNGVWELCTSSANNHTNVITATNVTADAWQCVGWFLSTNSVKGYMGATPLGLTTVATNTLDIPGGTSSLAVERIVSSVRVGGTTTRMTNQCDYWKMWIRRT